MINEVLQNIQAKLKAPKGQFNNFGGYNYRNCEDILEAVKPLLAENNATLMLSDNVVNIGERYYVKTTATLCVGSEAIETTAFAREEETKKGMDAAQITGAASSYARKYALNGLFAIDDTKDADTPPPPQNAFDALKVIVNENARIVAKAQNKKVSTVKLEACAELNVKGETEQELNAINELLKKWAQQ